jgi:NADPH2:quinone reductase
MRGMIMRAIGYTAPFELNSGQTLVDFETIEPIAKGHDLLVEVKAVSVNPVDSKQRRLVAPEAGQTRILGFDGAGIVKAVGEKVTLFQPGDAVFYAGAVNRQGSNAQFQLVDERITGIKPSSLSFEQAAAIPLTTLTAYETLFHRLKINEPVPSSANAILIIGGAGGVGSMAVQLARQLTDLTVISTASTAQSKAWVEELGAHHVLDHSQPLAPQVAALNIGKPAFIFSITQSEQHADDAAELIAPQGRFALIDDPKGGFDIMRFKRKAVSIHWESMFVRPVFGTEDMIEQHRLLSHVGQLVDEGKIRTTLNEVIGPINAQNLMRAHTMIESGKTRGKLVLSGF